MPKDPAFHQVRPEASPALTHPLAGGEDIQRLGTPGEPPTLGSGWGPQPAQGEESPEVVLQVPDAMAVFFAWERLRLLYNLILAVVTLVVLSGRVWGPLPWLEFPEQVLLANVCFCAGPVAEGYLCWVGANRRTARWLVFLMGTMLAALLTADAVHGPPGVLK